MRSMRRMFRAHKWHSRETTQTHPIPQAMVRRAFPDRQDDATLGHTGRHFASEDVVGCGKRVDEVAELTMNEPTAIMEALALDMHNYDIHRLLENEVE